MKKWIPWAIVAVLVGVIIYLNVKSKAVKKSTGEEDTVIIDQETGETTTVVEATGPIPSSGK